MSDNVYIHGTDILGFSEAPIKIDGAGIIPLAQAGGPQPALVIRVKNPGALVAKEGGAAGKLAFDAAPASITGMIYSKMREEMLTKFKEKGVDADVQVTTNPPMGPPPKKEFVIGAAVGAGAVGAGWGLWKLLKMVF